MDTLSIVLISVFSTLVVFLAAAVTYLVLYRKVTVIPQTGWTSYTVRERRPLADLFRRPRRTPQPRRGSDAWDSNISDEELGILRPTHSRAPSDPFQDPYDPYTGGHSSTHQPLPHSRSFSHTSTQSIPSSNPDRNHPRRAVRPPPPDFSDDEYEDSSLPHYAPPLATGNHRRGTSTPSTSAANTSQRFTPTSSPPRQSPPPSIIHHIDSFHHETLETTLTDIQLTLESANTILNQVASLPDETEAALLTPADLAKINELSTLTTIHTDLLEQASPHPQPLDVYTARLPKFKTLVAQGMAIIMAAESRRTRSLSTSTSITPSFASSFSASAFNLFTGGSTTATTPTTPLPRPQEVKRTQLLSRYADLKKTESFARSSLRQILERREARRGSPGSENREMELEVRMLGLRAFRERVALGRKLGVEDEDSSSHGEESWGLNGVDGEVGGERVRSHARAYAGLRRGRNHSDDDDDDGGSEDEAPVPPPPAYDERQRERERERQREEQNLLDSKELQ